MRMTICTGPIFPVPTVRGGAAQRLWEGMVSEFAARGHEVTVFAKAHPGQASEERVSGVRFVRWGGYEQSMSLARDLVWCLLYAIRASPRVPPGDVVVTNDFWMPAILPRLRPSAGSVVASIARFPKKQFALYGRCAVVAPVSETVANGIRKQTPWLADKVVVVPNCVDAAFLQTPCSRMTPEPDCPVRIMFAGRIHPEKGLDLLVDALRRMPPGGWECRIQGPVAGAEGGGGTEYVRGLQSRVQGLPVAFDKPVYDPRSLALVYDKADVLVYPSVAETGESFGLAPLEAMARGAVPLVSDLAVFREYLEPEVNGLVFNHRSQHAAEELAAKLEGLVKDVATRRVLGRAARETAERFSPGSVADRYLQLFDLVLSKKPQ